MEQAVFVLSQTNYLKLKSDCHSISSVDTKGSHELLKVLAMRLKVTGM